MFNAQKEIKLSKIYTIFIIVIITYLLQLDILDIYFSCRISGKMYFRTNMLKKKGLEIVELVWITPNILVSRSAKNLRYFWVLKAVFRAESLR